MQADWVAPAILALVALVVIIFFAKALAKARQRRREEFAETPAIRPEIDDGEALAERSAEADDQVAAARREEQIESEGEIDAGPDLAPESAVEVESEDEDEPERDRDDQRVPEPEPAPAAERREGTTAAPTSIDPVLEEGLQRTSTSLLGRINQIFGRKSKVDRALLDEVEEVLLTADVGVRMTSRLIDVLRAGLDANTLETAAALRAELKKQISAALESASSTGDPLECSGPRPHVILFVGVNGVGKTTTIGKVAAKLRERDKQVILAAGDTFRAAAVEQLQAWGERVACRVIRGETGADPASVVFNAIDHAEKTGADTVLADTAGRLHTKANLMDEIKKVKRAASKARDGAPDQIWLVVDATTGQNALQQAREFHQALELTGVILTKLDGTAKGGIVVAIAEALSLPVRFVGVGEKADDLRPFEPQQFVEALFAAGRHS
jgi:fused signal recognition particle receptor